MKKSKKRKQAKRLRAESTGDIYSHDSWDGELPPSKPKKLSPCPCGSGKVFRDCCRAHWPTWRSELPGAGVLGKGIKYPDVGKNR